MENGNDTAWTGDELAAALYAEQGFFVIASEGRALMPLGYIARPKQFSDRVPHSVPLRIVGYSTAEEFESQRRLSERLFPGSTTAKQGRTFYRVEAAD